MFAGPPAMARDGASAAKIGPSGLPLPRYVSLKSSRVNLRIGPGTQYSISWQYTREGLPVEIIQEYGHWRHVRDADGTEGWVYQSLLSGKRTAEAAPWMKGKVVKKADYIAMHDDPREGSAIVAKLQPGVVLSLDECDGKWCEAKVQNVTGWVPQAKLWGAYPKEHFN
ncbi:SH3 domain-containing protein [Pararhizobium mangrovi]|nr:SH3 domain-containing protein [Pararhizobium mangrovi]